MINLIKRHINRIIAQLVSIILRPSAISDIRNFLLFEKSGYHIIPTHYYSPIPNVRELAKNYPGCSQVPGINFRPDFQLELLKDFFLKFSAEYELFPRKSSDQGDFFLNNDAFSGIDPHIYYCLIREFKPKVIIEIGSGYSTLVGIQACKKNVSPSRYIAINPYPDEITSNILQEITLFQSKVEEFEPSFFDQLHRNDILFIDGSHVIRTGGDVSFLLLEVLPRLREGVVVHFHDIFLPFDYPEEWLTEKCRFWTEQYILQAYLIENSHIEILFASHYVSQKYPNEVKSAFPNASFWSGGSLWFRKS